VSNQADFPFFREQARELLTDAQWVEYLLKFLIGDALEIVKRN